MEDKSKELLLARAVLALNDRVTELEKALEAIVTNQKKEADLIDVMSKNETKQNEILKEHTDILGAIITMLRK